MKIEMKKFEINIKFDIKEKGNGEFNFDLEGYESELSEQELEQYLEAIKSILKSLQPSYIK